MVPARLVMSATERDHLPASRTMPSLASKMITLGGVLLLMLLSSIAMTMWVAWQLEGGTAAVTEAGRLRALTWQLATALTANDRSAVNTLIAQYDASLRLLQKDNPMRPLRVPGETASMQALADLSQQWHTRKTAWQADAPIEAAVIARQASESVRHIDYFMSMIEQQLARWTTLLHTVQGVVAALTLVAALIGFYAARRLIFAPLRRLREALKQAENGDPSVHVTVVNDDELGAIAAGFNRMNTRMQDLYANLERRVQEETAHLETERARLAVFYESAALAARADSLEKLAHGFAVHTRRALRADASVVRWADEQTQRYVILASDKLPESLTKGGYCLPAGDCFCGQPREQAEMRMFALHELKNDVLPVGLDIKQCQRIGYASVLSAPVKWQDQIVGEIDLFFVAPTVLNKEDRVLLDTLTSHLAGAMEGLRAQALRREAVVADERGLLARELHDSIAQSLSFLKIQAALLRDEIALMSEGPSPGVQRTLLELDAGIKESLSDVRELLLHFRTRTNHEDIIPALRTTLTKFEHQAGLHAELNVVGDGMALPPDVQIQVLHVVQEALSNVRKHAQARHVWVDAYPSPQWVITVRDDGRGFDAADCIPDETHVGLRIMRERAASIGATLDVVSAPKQGTRITLTLPERLPTTTGASVGEP